MNREEVKQKLNAGSSIPFEEYFINKYIKIYGYNREELFFLYDFGEGEEKFCSVEGLVHKID